jgi:nicotinate phosphoribosyltransferase
MKTNQPYGEGQLDSKSAAPTLPVFPGTSLALSTDLYQLTMAHGYLKAGMEDRTSVFHMFYRTAPFKGRYTVVAGIGPFADWLEALRFNKEDLEYLRTVSGKNGKPLFDEAFLDYLAKWRFRGSIDAVPEGTILFAHEPIVRVRAPLLDGQIIETALLAIVNYQTLIATKTSRIRLAAGSDEVLEFGLRRAHGLDGGLSGSRAAYIGGANATSNVLAGSRYGIPVRGTHAHSWVMAFDSEEDAFDTYADLFPHNSVLLVDTYDTLEGVKKAIDVGIKLREKGADLMGIRLDSGDLAYLSTQARSILDASGFENTKIVASNDLDERLIKSLKTQGAPIDIWGVGTKLITAFDEPALNGVYKLAAVENAEGEMISRMKISEQPAKTSIPGSLEVARLWLNSHCAGDVIYDILSESPPGMADEKVVTIISPEDSWKRKAIPTKGMRVTHLLQPLFENGERVPSSETLAEMRQRTQASLATFDPTIFRFDNPHAYAAGLSQTLFERRQMMRDHEFERIKNQLAGAENNGLKNSDSSQ